MSFESMLNEVYDNLENKQKNKIILPKLDINISTTNTYWKNIKQFLKTIKRGPEHFIIKMNHNIGETNWVSSSKSDGIVIIGRVKKDKILSFIQNYMKTYVVCNICNSVDTELNKNNTIRQYQLKCNCCKSNYTV